MTDKKFKKGDIIRIIESGDMVCDHRIDPKKQLWVVDEEGKSRPHGNTIYGLFTIDKAGELYESAAFPYAMELVEFPTSEEQECAWRIKAAVDKSREKIKLEDMTLAEIKEQKRILADAMQNAIARAVYDYHQKCDCGDVYVSVDTDIIPPIETEQGEVLIPSQPFYDIRIKFSIEDETD